MYGNSTIDILIWGAWRIFLTYSFLYMLQNDVFFIWMISTKCTCRYKIGYICRIDVAGAVESHIVMVMSAPHLQEGSQLVVCLQDMLLCVGQICLLSSKGEGGSSAMLK